jgi:hypothetical protein
VVEEEVAGAVVEEEVAEEEVAGAQEVAAVGRGGPSGGT